MVTQFKQTLIDLATAYGSEKGLSLQALGLRIMKDNTFFLRISSGGAGFRIDTYDKILRWFSDNWPEGLEWPEGISRPTPTGQEQDTAA